MLPSRLGCTTFLISSFILFLFEVFLVFIGLFLGSRVVKCGSVELNAGEVRFFTPLVCKGRNLEMLECREEERRKRGTQKSKDVEK